MRYIVILIALLVVGWLVLRDQQDAGETVNRAAREAAETAGVKAIDVEPGANSREIAEQIGQQVQSTIDAGKSRVDEAVDAR